MIVEISIDEVVLLLHTKLLFPVKLVKFKCCIIFTALNRNYDDSWTRSNIDTAFCFFLLFQTILADGQKIIDSFGYVYNDKRQHIRTTYLNLGTYFQLEYKGDLINKVTSYRSNGVKISTRVNVMRREADGNTIMWDQSTEATNGEIDTAYVYFNFKGGQLQSIRKYCMTRSTINR